MKKRILSLLLCALLTAQTLIACSETSAGETEDTQPEASIPETAVPVEEETAPLTDYELRQLIPDDLPDKTFDGAEFRVLTSDNKYGSKAYEIVAEDLNGDACNDAVYNRNIEIEERFEVEITCGVADAPQDALNVFVPAGTDDYHIVGFHNYLSYVAFGNKSLYNWNLVTNVNLDKPWHNKLANDAATLNGTLYGVCSDLAITSMTYTYAIFFNVDKIPDYGYNADQLYDLVRSGDWTIDKMIEITNTMYEDTNGNGERDLSDNYGFGYEITNPADVWLSAFDQPLVRIVDGTEVEIAVMSEKTVSAFEKLLDWHYNGEGFRIFPTQYDEETYFLSGQIKMAPLRFYAAYNTLRNMNDTYSILPYPKWDTDQQRYFTNADDKFTTFGFPITSYVNMEFVGTVFEALCAGSYKKVYPAYYDTALKGKYSSDPQTVEMIDLIMTGRNFDFSFQWGNIFQSLPYLVRNGLDYNRNNITSEYQKIERAIQSGVKRRLIPLYRGD